MILRLISIALAIGGGTAIWFGYQNITLLRGTIFWDYRYLALFVAVMLGLSLLEWVVGWLKDRL